MSKTIGIDDLKVGDFFTCLSRDGKEVYVARVTKVEKLRTLITSLNGKTACVHTVMFPNHGRDLNTFKSKYGWTWTRNFIPCEMYVSTWPEVLAWLHDAYETVDECEKVTDVFKKRDSDIIRKALKKKVNLTKLAPFDETITERARQLPKNSKCHSWLWDTLRKMKVWGSILSVPCKEVCRG